jgi:hypothetical protein
MRHLPGPRPAPSPSPSLLPCGTTSGGEPARMGAYVPHTSSRSGSQPSASATSQGGAKQLIPLDGVETLTVGERSRWDCLDFG